MIAPSPNEKRSDRSITSRLFYFMIGVFGALYLVGRFYSGATTPVVWGLAALGGGLIGLFGRSAVYAFLK